MPPIPEEKRPDRREMKTGLLLVNEGYVRQADIETALEIQQRETVQRGAHPRAIGEILCDLNLISPFDLSTVLRKYKKYLNLEEILIKHGSIDEDTLSATRSEPEYHPDAIGNILLQRGIITENQLYEAYSLQYNLPFKPDDAVTLPPRDKPILSRVIRENAALQFGIIPISLDRKRLCIAISDPGNIQVIVDLRKKQTEVRIESVLITPSEFSRLFHGLYGNPREPASLQPAQAPKRYPEEKPRVAPPRKHALLPEEIVSFILSKALQSKAATIHIKQDEAGPTLRFFGQREASGPAPLWFEKRFREVAAEVIGHIKTLAGISDGDRLGPREGILRTKDIKAVPPISTSVEFSVATCPTLTGEDITLTLIAQRWKTVSPTLAGLSDEVRTNFYRLLKKGNRIILITGPPGSPLSETVHAALSHLQNTQTPIVTLESPIKYHLPGSVQIPVSATDGLSWETQFRSALKLGPDVMMIDRLKDISQARCVFENAQSGPLFITTLHAEDSANALSSLSRMKIDSLALAGNISGVLCLHPVRKTCIRCRETYTPSRSEWSILFQEFPNHLTFFKGKGCPACNFSGYQGQLLLSELLQMTKPVREAVLNGVSEDVIRQTIMEEGLRTLMEDGLCRLEETSLEALTEDIPVKGVAAFRSRQRRNRSGLPGRTAYREIIFDPATQREALMRLHTAYERLAIVKGLRNGPSDPHVFVNFIHNYFNRICRAYRCRSVSFSIIDNHNGVSISAIPEKKGISCHESLP